jgi:tetratricopeptide (TPR) repeat protein
LAVSLGNQALLLKEIGKPSDALKLMQEQEAICRDSNLLPVLQSCLANQATIFFDRGDYGRALMLAQESESILRQVGPLVKLAAWLGQKANILKKLSRIDEVRTALKEQEQMCQELGDPGFVAGALMNQAMLLEDRNERRVVLEKARNIISRHGLESLTRRFDELEDALRSENVIP